MVICLERGADLNIAQLMPLPLAVSCFSKIQIGFTFLVLAHLGSPGQRAVKRVCVCGLLFLLISTKNKHLIICATNTYEVNIPETVANIISVRPCLVIFNIPSGSCASSFERSIFGCGLFHSGSSSSSNSSSSAS